MPLGFRKKEDERMPRRSRRIMVADEKGQYHPERSERRSTMIKAFFIIGIILALLAAAAVYLFVFERSNDWVARKSAQSDMDVIEKLDKQGKQDVPEDGYELDNYLAINHISLLE